jgi:hypothetical protein
VPSIAEPVSAELETNGDGAHNEQSEHGIKQPKSPLLTTHRLSTISLDNVSLEEDDEPTQDTTPKGTCYI